MMEFSFGDERGFGWLAPEDFFAQGDHRQNSHRRDEPSFNGAGGGGGELEEHESFEFKV